MIAWTLNIKNKGGIKKMNRKTLAGLLLGGVVGAAIGAAVNKTKKTKKIPLLTTRQIAIAATLGGLCFAWRALGLVIPMPVPGFVIDIREAIYVFTAFVYGPIVSIIISIMGGLPTPFPPMVWIGNAIAAPIMAYMWKNMGLWKVSSWKVKIPLIYGAYFVFFCIFITVLMYCAANIMGYWPFWPTYVFAWTSGAVLIWIAVQGALLAILIRAISPGGKTPKPDWIWPGGR